MSAQIRWLKDKLGNEAMSELDVLVEQRVREGNEEMLSIAGERFERRLGHELSGLRIDLAKEFAAMRTDLAKEAAALRTDLAKESGALRIDLANEVASLRIEVASTRADVLKWSFIFWIGQFAAVSAMMAFLLRSSAP